MSNIALRFEEGWRQKIRDLISQTKAFLWVQPSLMRVERKAVLFLPRIPWEMNSQKGTSTKTQLSTCAGMHLLLAKKSCFQIIPRIQGHGYKWSGKWMKLHGFLCIPRGRTSEGFSHPNVTTVVGHFLQLIGSKSTINSIPLLEHRHLYIIYSLV